MEKNILKNGELNAINAKYVAIGTKDIENWSNGEPFIIALNTEEDFENNGFDYENYKDMNVGETKDSCSVYEGILVIRIR
jgi:hypothetical protein